VGVWVGIEILLKKTKSVKYFSGQGVGDVNGRGREIFTNMHGI
jgi:hypothetical protein